MILEGGEIPDKISINLTLHGNHYDARLAPGCVPDNPHNEYIFAIIGGIANWLHGAIKTLEKEYMPYPYPYPEHYEMLANIARGWGQIEAIELTAEQRSSPHA